jgi:alpha-amylase/alpha-mannosidase (GH57 family)
MTAENPLSVLLLWHQHQPLYKDAVANRYELPWVRLHATKDYYDMAALLEEFPAIKVNFNLVPSLLTQIDDYAQGKAQEKFLELTLKRASDLSAEDKQFILQNFFMAHWENMVDPYPRYRELLDKRGRTITPEKLTRTQIYFKEQDWRDLQTWFNLTWFDPLWREKDPFIQALIQKGRAFTEDDKQKLLDKQREVCSLVVSKHKDLQDRGQIEITTTPYYHPILPLLCDTESAREALPHMAQPEHRFQHYADAQEQVRRAINDYRQRFGQDPKGMWPAEGSVSEEAARLFMEMNVRWIATDEAVLARSLAPAAFSRADLYEPYQFRAGDRSLNIFFRDHELSDAIGFVYASWDPEDAAEDFMRRLRDIGQRLRERDGHHPRPHVVPVILDGENCWEYYREDGLPFLRKLYHKLSTDPTLQTVRASDYLGSLPEIKTLPKLWAGSWIDANFAIWIGHSEDNKAWDLLYRTRQFLQNSIQLHPEWRDQPKAIQAWEEIYIAEGSDWCWWFGDDHSSANDEIFDYLFRKHLMNVYVLLGEKIPEDLYLPIKRKRPKAPVLPPTGFITPHLDGRVTNYFEWHPAGVYHTEAGGTGTMHRAQNLIKSIYFGFDLENLYFRIDFTRPITQDTLTGTTIQLIFLKPENHQITAQFGPDQKIQFQQPTVTPDPQPKLSNAQGIYLKIAEFAIPLNEMPPTTSDNIELILIIQKDGREQERWPIDSTLHFPRPQPDVFRDNWLI